MLKIGYYSYQFSHAGDDFLPLMVELVRAPLWILATPLHWYTVSAQAKTFLDRLSDLLEHRKDLGYALRGHGLAVICSGTDPAPPPHFAEPLRMTCEYLGMRFLGLHYGQFVDGNLAGKDAYSIAADFGDALWLKMANPAFQRTASPPLN